MRLLKNILITTTILFFCNLMKEFYPFFPDVCIGIILTFTFYEFKILKRLDGED